MKQSTWCSSPKRITKAWLVVLVCVLWLSVLQEPQIAAAQAPACTARSCDAGWRVYLPVLILKQPETVFGVQVYGRFDQPSKALDLMRSANVSWIRTQIAWRQVEPTNADPSAYDFSAYDDELLSSTRWGIRPIVTVLDNPAWAAQYRNGPINQAELEEFGQFIAAAVERYDGDGDRDAPGSPVARYWEFYNEPDSGDQLRAMYGQGYWGDYGAEYAAMLCTAHRYAKVASPQAQIVMGGVAHDWFRADGGPFVESFVDDVLAAGGGQCIDIMNFHYYPINANHWQSYGPGMIGKTEYFRTLLAKYGLTKPIMCTEAGWHSDTDSTWPSSPQEQAEFVVKLFGQVEAAGLISNIWWTWIDPGVTVGSFGLLTQQLTPKPAYYSYRYAAAKLGASRFVRQMSADELGNANLEGYVFSPDAPLYIIWSNDAIAHTVHLKGTRVRVLDIYGTVISTATDSDDGVVDGQVTISIDPAPVYVETLS